MSTMEGLFVNLLINSAIYNASFLVIYFYHQFHPGIYNGRENTSSRLLN